jgi:hypothetical protein
MGLYLASGQLFALLSWPTLQQKLTTITDNVPNVWRLNCLIKLAQGSGVFQVTTSNQNNLMEVANTSFVIAPDSMAQQPNALIVHEADANGKHIVLHRQAANVWIPEGWRKVHADTLSTAAGTTSTIQSPFSAYLAPGTLTTYNLGPANTMAVQINGQFRMIQSVNSSGVITLTQPVTIPSGTVTVTYYTCQTVWPFHVRVYHTGKAITTNASIQSIPMFSNLVSPTTYLRGIGAQAAHNDTLGRITVPVTGTYKFYFDTSYQPGLTLGSPAYIPGQIALALSNFDNGVNYTISKGMYFPAGGTIVDTLNMTDVLHLQAGDTIIPQANIPTNATFNGTITLAARFSIHLIGH